MGRIARGWKLTKLSLGVLRKDKEILLLPLMSAIITGLLMVAFIGGAVFSIGLTPEAIEGGYYGLIAAFIAFYIMAYFVSIFFNAAVIGCATIRLNGGDPTVRDGLKIAMDNIGRIFLWALFAATVGLVINAIQQRVGIIGKLILGGIGVAWTVVTYFVVPVLIYEGLGPWAAVKRSAGVFKNTWGETMVGGLGLGVVFVLLGLVGIAFIIVGGLGAGMVGMFVGLAAAVIYWIILGLVASAAQSILVAALYRYATTGKMAADLAGIRYKYPWAT